MLIISKIDNEKPAQGLKRQQENHTICLFISFNKQINKMNKQKI